MAASDITAYEYLVEATSVNKAPIVTKAQFGDGYVHRAFTGINKTKISWQVGFSLLSEADGLTLQGLLENGAVEGVLWRSPEDGLTTKKYLVTDGFQSVYPHPDYVLITTTLERLFEA